MNDNTKNPSDFVTVLILFVCFMLIIGLVYFAKDGSAQYQTSVYQDQGGDRINIVPGGSIAYKGNDFNVARGIQEVTGTAAIYTDLTTVSAFTTQLETIGTTAGDPAMVSATIDSGSSSLINVQVLQDDFSTNATAGVHLHWIAVGS